MSLCSSPPVDLFGALFDCLVDRPDVRAGGVDRRDVRAGGVDRRDVRAGDVEEIIALRRIGFEM